MVPLFDEGLLKPVIEPSGCSLEEVAEAHRYMESNAGTCGKMASSTSRGNFTRVRRDVVRAVVARM